MAGLFERLREGCAADWQAYTHHPFVAGLADGSLPETSFRHYLGQDYLFLIQFARAYALAAYKAPTFADIQAEVAGLSAIVDVEMGLHVDYCRDWGLSEADMAALPEAKPCIAYTRYVLEKGLAGDLLDLHAALAPCIVGYGEIGARLAADPATKTAGNPYAGWIDMYASADYQAVARGQIDRLDDLFARLGSDARRADLQKTFATATRLEVDFWEIGWSRIDAPA